MPMHGFLGGELPIGLSWILPTRVLRDFHQDGTHNTKSEPKHDDEEDVFDTLHRLV